MLNEAVTLPGCIIEQDPENPNVPITDKIHPVVRAFCHALWQCTIEGMDEGDDALASERLQQILTILRVVSDSVKDDQ